MLKSYRVGGGGGGLQHFSVSPRPLGFGTKGFGAKGLGPGLDNRYLLVRGSIRSSLKYGLHTPYRLTFL